MAWTHIGTDYYLAATTGQGSRTINAGATGDLRVLTSVIVGTMNITTMSGGGVTQWTRAGSVNTVTNNTVFAGKPAAMEIWYGLITSTGTALTINFSATIGTTSHRVNCGDFRSDRVFRTTKGAQYTAASGQTAFAQAATAASPITFPSVTTTRDSQLVVGSNVDAGNGTGYAFPTAGVTYATDANSNFHEYILSTSGGTAYAPTVTYTGTDTWAAQQVIIDDGWIAPHPGPNQAVNRAATR